MQAIHRQMPITYASPLPRNFRRSHVDRLYSSSRSQCPAPAEPKSNRSNRFLPLLGLTLGVHAGQFIVKAGCKRTLLPFHGIFAGPMSMIIPSVDPSVRHLVEPKSNRNRTATRTAWAIHRQRYGIFAGPRRQTIPPVDPSVHAEQIDRRTDFTAGPDTANANAIANSPSRNFTGPMSTDYTIG